MTETFAAVHDALERALVRSVGVTVGELPQLPRPAYLPEIPPQTVAQYRNVLAKWTKLGIVKTVN